MLSSISACATGSSSTACPPIKEYTREQQVQVADELKLLPPDNQTSEFMKDYSQLREQIRACRR